MNKVWIKKNKTGKAEYDSFDKNKFFQAILSCDGTNDIVLIDGAQYILSSATFENPKVLFKITQSSTNAPVIAVLQSNVGLEDGDIVSAYDDEGTFHLTFPDGWLGNNPAIKVVSEGINVTGKLVFLPYDDTRLDVNTRSLAIDFTEETITWPLANGVVNSAIIEVEILPE